VSTTTMPICLKERIAELDQKMSLALADLAAKKFPSICGAAKAYGINHTTLTA
jgi:hypothetical protein